MRAFGFRQFATNPQSFPLSSSKFVSAMIYQPKRNQRDTWHEIEVSDQIPHPLWMVIKCPAPGYIF